MCTYLGNIPLYWSRYHCLLELCSVDNQALQNYLTGKSLAGQEKKKNFTKEWLLTFCP